MGLFSRRQRPTSLLGVWFNSDGDLPPGYHRLLDCPEVGACVDRISGIVSTCTIYQMRSTRRGDVRVKDALSRFVDIDPWPGLTTGPLFKSWIVSTLLANGDGNAFVLPHRAGGRFTALEPMPGAAASEDREHNTSRLSWRGREFGPDDVLHFRLHADPDQPWRGRGYKIPADRLASSLLQTETLKAALSSPKYKPPLIVSVNSDSDLSGDDAREEIRKKYLEDTDSGKPWILPAELFKVEQIKPLTLTDLAVKDTMELDKKAVAAIYIGIFIFLLCGITLTIIPLIICSTITIVAYASSLLCVAGSPNANTRWQTISSTAPQMSIVAPLPLWSRYAPRKGVMAAAPMGNQRKMLAACCGVRSPMLHCSMLAPYLWNGTMAL